jgi:glycosyltransferase involved in cell wall biosynthesis
MGDRLDVSVLLATRDRGPLLRDTFSSFCQLDTSGLRWELIAIDNGSTDDTGAVLAEFSRRLPLAVLHEPRPGKNAALNRGLELARGELLVFTDDDVLAERGWLQAHTRAARDWPEASIFAGRIVPRFPEGTPRHLQEHGLIRSLLCEFAPQPQEGFTTASPLGANFSVRARAMQNLRFADGIGPGAGKNYAMGSETELLKRLTELGNRTVYLPGAMIEHVIQPHQLDLQWLLGRNFRLGRGLSRMGYIYGEAARRFLGVPFALWRELARTQVRYALSRFLGWPRNFDIACEYQRLRGALHEHRLMSREPGAPSPR